MSVLAVGGPDKKVHMSICYQQKEKSLQNAVQSNLKLPRADIREKT